jgi:hypothetical protein
MVKALAAAGYKTQVQPLSHFYDDYGLKAGEDDGEEEEEDEDEDDEDMEDGSYTSGSDEDMD